MSDPSSQPTQPLTDEAREEIRDWHNKTRDRRVGVLLGELDRLHSWNGLLELLDEHWPEDIFPTREDDTARDPGPRIVSLLRWTIRLRRELAEMRTERDDLAVRLSARTVIKQTISELEDERDALAARIESVDRLRHDDEGNQFEHIPGYCGPGCAGCWAESIGRALGLDQDGRGNA